MQPSNSSTGAKVSSNSLPLPRVMSSFIESVLYPALYYSSRSPTRDPGVDCQVPSCHLSHLVFPFREL